MPLTKPKGKNGNGCRDTKFPKIPQCSCGSERLFEFQIMPSILHVLDVDQHTTSIDSGGAQGGEPMIEWAMNKSTGGMNWGVIAVYSCSQSCDQSREEFVIVQDSGDGEPRKGSLSHPTTATIVDDEEDDE